MDKEKLLLRLSLEIDLFKAHVNRLKPTGYVIHPLDVELLRKKATEVYDLVVQMDLNPVQIADKQDIKPPVVIEKVAEINPSPEPVEPVKKEVISTPVQQEEEAIGIKNHQPEVVFAEKVVEPPKQMVEEVAVTPTKVEVVIEEKATVPVVEKAPEEVKPAPEPERQPKIAPTRTEPMKTTLDLFSSTESSLADRLTHQGEDKSLAGKMQQERLLNIRSAIGINEKFLFVNELFKGDLSRYNRVIDELNSMKTKEGADTYLLELRIEGQWPESLEAFQKLKEIVDRKF
ncbi:MAG: hypothetical protein Q8O72_12885 [Bacteroidales bacterium]|jgi:hypothetical protein|nr:hypothetical protein [Bacteroidales bacterium]